MDTLSLGTPLVLVLLSSHQFKQSLALGHAGEYAHVARALAPLASALISSKTISALQVFHPLNFSSPCLDSLLDSQLESNLEFSLYSFKSTFIRLSHLLVGGFSSMVFKHF